MLKLKIRFIALECESERIEFMNGWLEKTGLTDWEWLPGVSIQDVSVCPSYDDRKRVQRYGYPMTPSEVGCFLAHRDCWEYAVSENLCILILESDSVFCGDKGRLCALLESIMSCHDEWDLIRLHGIFEKNELWLRKITSLINEYTLEQSLGDPMGAGAYLVTPNGARKLLKASELFFQPVDVFLSSNWMHRCRFRVVKPYPFDIVKFPSVIGQRKRPKQTTLQRLRIESHRLLDDIFRICYLPVKFFR